MRRAAGSSGPRPLPDTLVSELLQAGLSPGTVQAMEHWKAQEVLDLLHSTQARDPRRWASTGSEAGTPLFLPRAEELPRATI